MKYLTSFIRTLPTLIQFLDRFNTYLIIRNQPAAGASIGPPELVTVHLSTSGQTTTNNIR